MKPITNLIASQMRRVADPVIGTDPLFTCCKAMELLCAGLDTASPLPFPVLRDPGALDALEHDLAALPTAAVWRGLYYYARRYDYVALPEADGRASIGRALTLVSALAGCSVAMERSDDKSLCFIHFEIRNARAFLHRGDRHSSLNEVRARYTAIRIITEWSVHRLLADVRLPETCAVWLTVARAVLIVPTCALVEIEQSLNRLRIVLPTILPGLKPRIRHHELPTTHYAAGQFRQTFGESFGDQPDGAAHLDDLAPEGPTPFTTATLTGLEQRLAHWPRVKITGNDPILGPLKGWLSWSNDAGDADPGDWLKLSPIWNNKIANRCIGDSGSPLTLLRGDLRGYKADMLVHGGDSLMSLASRCAWNQWNLMDRAAETMRATGSESPLSVVHSFGDDLIVYGHSSEVREAAISLEDALAPVAGGFFAALVDVKPGMSDHDVGRESGRLARERRLGISTPTP